MWDDLRIAFIQLMPNAAFEKSWYVPLPWNLELEKVSHATWLCRNIIEIYVQFKTWLCLGNKNQMEVARDSKLSLRAMARWKVTETGLKNWWLRSLDF